MGGEELESVSETALMMIRNNSEPNMEPMLFSTLNFQSVQNVTTYREETQDR